MGNIYCHNVFHLERIDAALFFFLANMILSRSSLILIVSRKRPSWSWTSYTIML